MQPESRHRAQGIHVHKYTWEFPESGPLGNPDTIAATKRLLPPNRDERISFYLTGTHFAMANAIRRTVIDECIAVAFELKLDDIQTDEPYILPQHLALRVAMIRISQKLTPGQVFTLDVTNTSVATHRMYVTSGDLKPESPNPKSDAKVNPHQYFDDTYRLTWLSPGRFLRFRATVVEGRGFMNSKFSIATYLTHKQVDFMNVRYLGSRGRISGAMVRTSDVMGLLGRKDVRISGRNANQLAKASDPRELFDRRVLIVPNLQHLQIAKPSMRPDPNDYDLMIENTKVIKVDMHAEAEFLRTYSSMNASPREYFLEYRTYGNISATDVMIHACRDLEERMESVLRGLQRLETQTTGGAKDDFEINKVSMIRDGKLTTFRIMEENYTIGGLLSLGMFEADRNIGNVRAEPEHPLTRVLALQVMHPDALGLLIRVCRDYIDAFRRLGDDFRGRPADIAAPNAKASAAPKASKITKSQSEQIQAPVAKGKPHAVRGSGSVQGSDSMERLIVDDSAEHRNSSYGSMSSSSMSSGSMGSGLSRVNSQIESQNESQEDSDDLSDT